MAEITIRFRSPKGQYNVKTDLTKQLSKLLTETASAFGITAAKLAARLYKDPTYENRLIRQSFAMDTQVSQYFQKNGQIVYVKLIEENDKEEAQFKSLNEKPLNEMSMEELYQYTIKPQETSPGCVHGQGIYCIKCLKWWEERSVKAAGINPLGWEKFKQQRMADQKREDLGRNVSTVSDVRKDTVTQVKITAESAKVFSVYISTEFASKLSAFMTKRYFNHEFRVRLYGENNHGHINIQHGHILQYQTLFGAQVIQDGYYYQDLNVLADRIIQKFFGLQWIGNGYASFSGQLTSKNLISSCKDGKNLALLIRQYDSRIEDASQQENVQDDIKFKILSQTTQKKLELTVGAKQRDAYAIEAYTVTDQLNFLYKEKQINPIQGVNPFEITFLQKQIIDNQFKETIDTAAFLTRIFQLSRGPGGETVRITQKFPADLIFKFTGYVDDTKTVEENAAILNSKNENFGKELLFEAVVKYSIETLFDPDFLLYCAMCGLNPLESNDLKEFAHRLKTFLL